MQLPLQITFRHMEPSEAVEARLHKEAEKLERFFDHIMSCRISVEAPHGHHHQGRLYKVRIDLTLPGAELAASREHHDNHAHEDVYVAIRDAFDAIQRQLEDYARRRRGHVKTHELPTYGQVIRLYPFEDYGIIQTADGREIYFHRNSLLNIEFDKLEEGTRVRFVEVPGDQGPQASAVQL